MDSSYLDQTGRLRSLVSQYYLKCVKIAVQPVDANDIWCKPTVNNCTIKGFRNLLLQEALLSLPRSDS